MVRCSFCEFVNEAATKFCRRCNTDLAVSGEPVTVPVSIDPTPGPDPVAAAAPPVDPPLSASEVVTKPLPPTPPPPPAPPANPPDGVLDETRLPATVRVNRLPRVERVEGGPGDSRLAFVLKDEAAEPPPTPVAPPPKPGKDDPTAALPPRRGAPPPGPASDEVPTAPLRAPPAGRSRSTPSGATPFPLPPSGSHAGVAGGWPTDAPPKLVVLRGLRINAQYPIYEGKNFVGRADDKPVDIDLEDQEPADRIWASRQHAVITFVDGALLIEDLNSLNGTFVNRTRIHPGRPRPLRYNDVIQIGTVQLKVTD
jgi:hypothetical protein